MKVILFVLKLQFDDKNKVKQTVSAYLYNYVQFLQNNVSIDVILYEKN